LDFTGERWIPGQVDQRIEDDHQRRYQFALRFSRGRRVLDIACGTGAGAYLLATDGAAASVDGVDISADTIAHAREHYQHPCLRFEVSDITTYRPVECFDLITCFETIEHVSDELLVLHNLRSWLRPGGLLLVSSPNRPITSPGADAITDPPLNRFHVREFTPRELRQRVEAVGFTDVRAFGQRLRWRTPSGFLDGLLNRILGSVGADPDRDSTPEVRPYWFRTPRYFVLMARA
jgi:SAM-dependent methyltransferase